MTATDTRVEVVLPEMGESVTEGTVTRWLVAVGDEVELEQPLVEISTDKVDAEIPSPTAGTVIEIRCEEGDIVAVDAVLAVLGTDADAKPASPAPPAPPANEESEGVGPAVATTAATPPPSRRRERILATPVARRIAAREGIDLAEVAGRGVRGRITRADIEQALAQPAQERPVAEPPSPAPPASSASAGTFSVAPWSQGEQVTLEPMSRIRRLTADHMVYSQATSVHVTTVFHADFSNVVATRNRVKDSFLERYDTKLTYMPFIFRSLTRALADHPKFNASISGTDIVYKRDINLGMAVATEAGLIVPVIHGADKKSLVELAQTANDLAERARTKKLKPDDVMRGTFTVTNPGVYGSLFGTPIINQPQVSVLCIGTIEKRPVVIRDIDGHDALGIRPMSYLALTYDHRLIDGADAEIFMGEVLATLRNDAWPELDD